MRSQNTGSKLSAHQLCLAVVLVLYSIISTNTFVSASDEKNPENLEVEIHNTFKPETCDRKARATDVVTLHYKGTLKETGHVFDSSHERGEPFSFQLGIGQVIVGWEKGLLGVCAGEKRKLVVPPHLGYGDIKHDQIPPRSTLIFEIEVLKIEDGPKPINVFKEIDADSDNRLSRKEVGEFLKKQLQHAQPHGDVGSVEDPDQLQMVDEIFMHEDKDKDDYITHEEFSGPKYDHDEL